MATSPASTSEPIYTHDLEAEVDEFERKDFAQRIANTVLNQPLSHSSLIVSIVGAWGSGKSTVLKYIQAELAQKPCKIATFNPWRYAGEDALLYHLFEALVKAIDGKRSVMTKWQEMQKTASEWKDLYKAGIQTAGSAASVLLPGSGSLVKGALSSILPSEFKLRVDEIREQARKHLSGSTKRIVMVIDDVDRLDPQEILLLFRSLKLIADLPNTTFIIAMDEEHVSQVIGKHIDGNPETGRRYIEKIVNVRLTLPAIPDHILEDYALKRLSRVWVLAKGDVPQEQSQRTGQIFRNLHMPFITTPRRVKTVENAFAFALGLLPDEVDAGDVLLLEATRILHPKTFEAMPRLIPTAGRIAGGFIMDPNKHEKASKERREEVMRLLLEGFPSLSSDLKEQVEGTFKNWFPQLSFAADATSREKWRQEKRICSMDYFWRYFSYAIHGDDIHDARVREWILLCQENPKVAAEELDKHFGNRNARAFLKKLRDEYAKDPTYFGDALTVLARVAPSHTQEPTSAMQSTIADEAAQIVSRHIKNEPDYKKRMDFAVHILRTSNDLTWNFTLSNHIPNEYLLIDPGQDTNRDNFRKSPFDEELARQSLQAYEKGDVPEDNRGICDRVWSIYRNHQLMGHKPRVERLLRKNPKIGLHFLAGGCVFGSSESHNAACWQWKEEKGLPDVQRLMSSATLSKVLKTLPAKPKNYEPPSRDFEYLTLEEVGWACLETMKKRDAEAKAQKAGAGTSGDHENSDGETSASHQE